MIRKRLLHLYTSRRQPEAFARARPGIAHETHSSYDRWTSVIPLPPDELIKTTGPSTLERFLVVGDAWNQAVCKFVTEPYSTLLDIGCGCGKLARFLITNPFVEKYVGFDPLYENIEWCNEFIAPLGEGRLIFLHYDIQSNTYNRNGRIKASDVVFPAPDRSVDVAVAASLFTHLLEEDARHYLNEIQRTLKASGVAVLSIHVEPAEGNRYSGDEDRIDVEQSYFIELAKLAGLRVRKDLGTLCGQQTLVLGLP